MTIFDFIYWFSLLAFCFAFYLAAGLAINVAYHRGLSHRAFEMKKPFERFFVLLALPAGTPVQWVGNHRFHHRHADESNDPHSPNRDGFWFAHCGWYIGTKNPFVCFFYSLAGPLRMIFDGWNRPRTNRQFDHLAKDVSGDKFYDFVSRPIPFMLLCWLEAFVYFGFAYLIWGKIGIAILWLTLVVIYNLGDAIDSVAHLYGTRPFAAAHFARNNNFLGIFALGEGWHANHHVFPASAKHGLFPDQFDFAWEIIRFFERLKIIKNVRIPTIEQINLKLISRSTGEQKNA